MAKKRRRSKRRLKLKKRVRTVGLAVLVVISTLVTLTVLYVFRSLGRPFVRAEGGGYPPFSWSGATPVSLAWLVGPADSPEQVAVLHLDPHAQRAVLIRVAPEELTGVGISERVRSLAAVTNLPIKGYLFLETEGLSELREILGADASWPRWRLNVISKLPDCLSVFRRDLLTNLSMGEVFQVARFLAVLREDRRVVVNLSDTSSSIGGLCFDEVLQDEGLRILILNGTREGGLAAHAARWVRSMGGFVLAVGNAPQQGHEGSMILATDISSYTVKRLAASFAITDLRTIGKDVEWAKRADVVIILGLDKVGFFW